MKVHKVHKKETLNTEKVNSVLRTYTQSRKDDGNSNGKSKEWREDISDDDDAEFEKYKEEFKRTYDNDSDEGKKKKANFKNNLAIIRQRNKEGKSFKLGMGPFTDMSPEEFKDTILMNEDEVKRILEEIENNENTDEETSFAEVKEKTQTKGVVSDWTSYMGTAKNQGSCGSCWAFSTAGALEGNFNYKYNQLYDFSEQYLIDCDTSYNGCSGGWQAFTYIKNNGINLESYYPYEAKQNSSCEKSDQQVASVSSISSCTSCSFDTWKGKLASGPMLVVMDADSSDIQNYSSGIIDFETNDCDDINHGVVAVAYETGTSDDTLTFRNSWGSSWGEDGNFRVKREDSNNNTCYLTKYAYRPEPIIYQDCIIAYQHGNYSGTNYMMCAEDDTSEIQNRGTMSSVRLGKNTQVTLYDKDNCEGNSVTVTSDTSAFSTIGFNDQTQSFAITSDSPPDGCVWMYRYFCFSGGYIETCSDVERMGNINFNDEMSSIRLGAGVTKVRLYQHGVYSGLSLDITSDITNLKTLGFDQYVSSLKINP